ncbi:MAG TPA: hypothetical protein VFH47_08045, partial [Candidatus Thermoplasmatota archaeon]|nr:hypothetical protein [Candidatus Thermoplasmatota archaeon]
IVPAAVFVVLTREAGEGGPAPDLQMAADDASGSATVLRVDDEVRWGELQVVGCANAVAWGAAGVATADTVVAAGHRITGCQPGETLVVRHIATGSVVLRHQFAARAPQPEPQQQPEPWQ